MSAILSAERPVVTALDNHSLTTDVLIIGAGLAGLSTALALPKSLKITILSKAALETCSSHYAQGGIAASLAQDDSIADHVNDTLSAGAGLCAAANSISILSAGQQAVQWLCGQGVPFTTLSQLDGAEQKQPLLATLQTTELHLTQEGGHGCRRVAHADDATGRHIMQTLAAQAQAASNISILAYHEALTLLTAPLNSSLPETLPESSKESLKDTLPALLPASGKILLNKAPKPPLAKCLTKCPTKCLGALVFDQQQQRQLKIYSRAVVLASGGLGQLFQRASAPNVCMGDGLMMAWQAGCRLANLEFVQFHPTGLALANSSFLISEALRGEGGKLYCPQTGERFMLAIDSRAELAPRDIVARAIAKQIQHNGLGFVHLDVSHLPADFLRQHFPQIYQTLLNLGIDITTSPIPVAPTAHYSCGGVVTSAEGLTDVQGLYAAGEVAYTGLHGANRLASNSLLECVVVGRNIAAHVPDYLSTAAWTAATLTALQLIKLPVQATAPTIAFANNHQKTSTNPDNGIDKVADIDEVDEVANISAQLKQLMSSHMGISRNAAQLEQALMQIQLWQRAIQASPAASLVESVKASSSLGKLACWRLARQLRLTSMIVQSAYQRCESRGGHYRQDYPDLAASPLISVIEPLIAKPELADPTINERENLINTL
jgi:L-aspartate oxidase